MGIINKTTPEINTALETTINPSMLVSYLPVSTPFTSPLLTAGEWTKVLVVTTAKKLVEFAVSDSGGGDLRYQYQGATTKSFTLTMTSSVETSVASTVVEFAMSRGQGATIDDLEPGVYSECISKSTDETSALPCVGFFEADPNDYIAIYLKVSKTSTVIMSGLSIVIMESN